MGGLSPPVARRSRITHRCGGRLPRCISRLAIDGGTSFMLRVQPGSWHPLFKVIVDWLEQCHREDHRDTPCTMLPLPRPPTDGAQERLALPRTFIARRYIDETENGDDVEQLDPRLMGWTRAPECRVFFGGKHQLSFRFYFEDQADVKLWMQPDADGKLWWCCKVTAKARELYELGLGAWLTRWLGLWSWLLQGRWCTAREAFGLGWKTTQWHLNSDFVDLDIQPEDWGTFLKVRRMRLFGRSRDEPEGDDDDGDELELELEPEGDRDMGRPIDVPEGWDPETQTLQLGPCTSDVQVVLYRKSSELRDNKRIEPAMSKYSETWRRLGWDEVSEVTRVEARDRKSVV